MLYLLLFRPKSGCKSVAPETTVVKISNANLETLTKSIGSNKFPSPLILESKTLQRLPVKNLEHPLNVVQINTYTLRNCHLPN